MASLVHALDGSFAGLATLTFSDGSYPSRFTVAQISPRLKKPGFDPGDPASYRPNSNLNSIGNVLERLFLAPLDHHVSCLHCLFQSAYRRHYSPETALLKLSNDEFEAVGAMKVTVLVALDLSEAFDTVDHSVFISRLEHTLGLGGLALEWVRAYLSDRASFVKIRG